MGCSASTDVYEIANIKRFRPEFESLRLRKREITRLYDIFKKADSDCSGSIVLLELLNHLDIERTAFSERVFSIFDENKSGAIEFREFVLALWNYCTLSRASLDVFAFDLYDSDSNGFLGVSEIQRLMRDIYGESVTINHHAKSMTSDLMSFERMGHKLDVQHFCSFSKTHGALLFPAFRMQQVLQKATLGCETWARVTQRRIELSKGRTLSVAQFMQLHLNRNLYSEVTNSSKASPHSASTVSLNSDAKLALSVTGTLQHRSGQPLTPTYQSLDCTRLSRHRTSSSSPPLLSVEDMFLYEMTVAAANTLATEEVKVLSAVSAAKSKDRLRIMRRTSGRRKSASIHPVEGEGDCEVVSDDVVCCRKSSTPSATLKDKIDAID